jgi:hypothetical protein
VRGARCKLRRKIEDAGYNCKLADRETVYSEENIKGVASCRFRVVIIFLSTNLRLYLFYVG